MKTKIRVFWFILVVMLSGCGGGSSGDTSNFNNSANDDGDNSPKFDEEKQEYHVEEGRQLVAIIKATDNSNVVNYDIKGEDSKYFDMRTITGELSFRDRPDYEAKKTYSIILVARDLTGHLTEKSITVNIDDVNEDLKDTEAPIFESNTNLKINEQENSNEVRLLTNDRSDVTYSLTGSGLKDFEFDNSTGVLRAKDLTQPSYQFDVVARDEVGNISRERINIQVDNNYLIPQRQEENVDNSKPIFTSSNSIIVPRSTQLDYMSAPSILQITTDDSSLVNYSVKDNNYLYIMGDELYFLEQAFPLNEPSYLLIVLAIDSAGNESSQEIKISIDNDVGDTTAPRFLSSNLVSVPFSEQSNYQTAPEVLLFETDEVAEYYLEGDDAEAFFLYRNDDAMSGGIYFTSEAIPLKKSSYTFVLVARDNSGNDSRQNITINILDYSEPSNNDIPLTPTNISASDGDYTGEIAVEWSAVTGASYYMVYESSSPDGEYHPLPNYSYEHYTYISGYEIDQGIKFYYKVQSCNSYGCSELSSYDSGYGQIETVDVSNLTLTDEEQPSETETSYQTNAPFYLSNNSVDNLSLSNNTDNSYILQEFIASEFSTYTIYITGSTEAEYDFISVYDENGNRQGYFSGNIDNTIEVEGSHFYIVSENDGSNAMTSINIQIEENSLEDPLLELILGESPSEIEISYQTNTPLYLSNNNVDNFSLSNNNDNSYILQEFIASEFSTYTIHITGSTEAEYDFISVYDENGNRQGYFSGNIDNTVEVEGSYFYIVSENDGSNALTSINIEISNDSSSTIESTPNEYVDSNGYWRDEIGSYYFHFSDNGIDKFLGKDNENDCYNDFTYLIGVSIRIDFDTFREENIFGEYDVSRDTLLTVNFNNSETFYLSETSPDEFNSKIICEE